MNVLSVDWDFFFPDVRPYDWGHRESTMFIEALWTVRGDNRNLRTGARAIDEVWPDKTLLKGFWKRTIKYKPCMLAVAESHMDLYRLLEANPVDAWDVWNFDQHHDLGYGKFGERDGRGGVRASNMPALECGNWALWGLAKKKIRRYHLIYPPWRAATPETIPPVYKRRVFVHDCHPAALPHFEIVFICRSGAWTPSWADDAWITFIEHWAASANIDVWESKLCAEKALEPRQPDAKTAREMAEEWAATRGRLREINARQLSVGQGG